jgi:hypothetical protein
MVELSTLKHGFVVYFADNVLVMLMATTAGTLGLNLFQQGQIVTSEIAQQALGILLNLILATVLYFYAAHMFRKAEEEQDSESDSDTGIPALGLIQADATSGYSHMLQMLPWLIIVPMTNLPVLIIDELRKHFDNEPDGKLFISQFAVFMAFLITAIAMSRIYAARPDCGAGCESYPTFLLNSFNHAMLSCTGKALHLLENVQYDALTGEAATKNHALFVKMIFLIGLTWFLLVHTWPRLTADNLQNKLFKTTITTITVYAWAFSFINNLWTYFHDQVPNGDMWYWLLMGVCCLIAILLAYISDGNFYGGPSDTGAGFGLMLCWTIDFGVWWAWCQVMTNTDNWATGGNVNFTSLLLVNSGMLVVLIVVTCLVYMFADLQTMEDHSIHRHRHTHHHKHA